MSGIAGILNFDGAPVDRGVLCEMTACMSGRGPDAQEIWIDGKIGLGNALLRSAFESADELQPSSIDGRVWITADCRIDGRDDLIAKLASRQGEVCRNAPDSELILRAYLVWDERCLEHLLGDFSFAIWDGQRRKLFCARDHFGIKSFYYARTEATLVFSNTLNSVRLHPAVSDELDELGIADFLVFGHVLDLDRSSFAAIHRLPPAHTLTVSGSDVRVDRYWDAPVEDVIHYTRRHDYIEHFRELLERAIRDRLRTNRAVVFMSGGLDSTGIGAVARKILLESTTPFDLRAHTMVFDRLVGDRERRYSQAAAEAVGIPIFHVPMDGYRFPSDRSEPEDYPPEPRALFDRGRVVDVFRSAADAARVFLWGYCADSFLDEDAPGPLESFIRNSGHIRLARDFLWLTWSRGQVPRLGVRTLIGTAVGQAPAADIWPYPEWLEPNLQQRLGLHERFANQMKSQNGPRTGSECDLINPYWTRLFEDHDAGSMGLAAESRHPYADVRLVRFLRRVPVMPWRTEKNLLRVAMKGMLPGAILRRRKTPLAGNPWALMLAPAHTRWWDPVLTSQLPLERFIDVEKAKSTVANVVAAAQAGGEHRTVDIVNISLRPVSLALWLEHSAQVRPTPARAEESGGNDEQRRKAG